MLDKCYPDSVKSNTLFKRLHDNFKFGCNEEEIAEVETYFENIFLKKHYTDVKGALMYMIPLED